MNKGSLEYRQLFRNTAIQKWGNSRKKDEDKVRASERMGDMTTCLSKEILNR